MFNKFALIARRDAVSHPLCSSKGNRAGRTRGTRLGGSEHVVGIGSRTDPRTTEHQRSEECTIHVWRACHACTAVCWWENPHNGWEWKGIHCIPPNDRPLDSDAVLWRPLRNVQRSEPNLLSRVSILTCFFILRISTEG